MAFIPALRSATSSVTCPWSSVGRLLLTLVAVLPLTSGTKHVWEAPGCYLVGHSRMVTIPDCVPFEVHTNACRGFCMSYAIPTSRQTQGYNRNLILSSRAECCNIMDTHDVNVVVACRDGFQQITFKSARSCACSICRHER